jgi:hypothetical protein
MSPKKLKIKKKNSTPFLQPPHPTPQKKIQIIFLKIPLSYLTNDQKNSPFLIPFFKKSFAKGWNYPIFPSPHNFFF